MLTQETLMSVLKYNPDTGVFNWNGRLKNKKAGCLCQNGYEYIKVLGRPMLSHRLAWLYMTGSLPDKLVDHINGVKTDNRWCNLREADKKQNACNSKPIGGKTSALKGVSWDKVNCKWVTRIKVGKKSLNMGRFTCPASAHFAYQIAADTHFGEYARAL